MPDEQNTILGADEYAAIWGPDGYRIAIPHQEDEDEALPIGALAILACAVRLMNDDAFAKEMVDWIENRMDGAEGGE